MGGTVFGDVEMPFIFWEIAEGKVFPYTSFSKAGFLRFMGGWVSNRLSTGGSKRQILRSNLVFAFLRTFRRIASFSNHGILPAVSCFMYEFAALISAACSVIWGALLVFEGWEMQGLRPTAGSGSLFYPWDPWDWYIYLHIYG